MSKLKKLLPLIFALLLIIGAAVFAFMYFHSKAEADNFKSEIAAIKVMHTLTSADITAESETSAVGIDHAALREQNSDYLCWLTIPETEIDYPVCACKKDEPDYYLNFDFWGRRNKFGTLFADVRCDLSSDLLFVYAHHNNYGTMFSELHGYKNKEFWENHKTVILDTEDGVREYTVFAAILASGSYTEDDWSIFECLSMSEKEFSQMLENINTQKLYDTEILPEYSDNLLALVTCEYSRDNNRLVVLAKEN